MSNETGQPRETDRSTRTKPDAGRERWRVALRRRRGETQPPKPAAERVNSAARRIRAAANAHELATIENAPLARALYAGVDLDEEVRPEHYRAVAEAIGYVRSLMGRAMPEDRRRNE